MSWDVIVQSFDGQPPDIESLVAGEAENPKPLGTASAIRKKIDANLVGVDWTDAENGVYEDIGFAIVFTIGSEKPIDHVMLSVHGGEDAVKAMISFAQPNKWLLFDLSENAYLNLENPTT